MFEWKETYEVGVTEIDMQHRQLFLLAEHLHQAMLSGQAKSVLARLLGDLVSYTRSHFANEESLMRSSRYSAFASHKFEHDELTRKVLAFQQAFEAGRTSLTVDLLHFIKEWLSHHIGNVDKKMGAHLCAQVI